ncbi:MAG TPA: hypothetical protein VMF09_06970 [Solirubrobacteraceae bacterium]|nr:hypothetical protein [Solirubrobacteraceae bacterium]
MQTPGTPTIRSGAQPRAGRRRRRRALRRLPLPAATALALALALAGCGSSSSSPGVAHVGSTSASSGSGGSGASGGGAVESKGTGAPDQAQMVKFAQCMRTHGEPEFPEPVEGNIQIHSQNGHGPNPESPQFQAAEKACSKYAPQKVAPSPAQQKEHEEQALKFSECMRHNGVPDFPDPNFSGGGSRVTLKISKSGGINPSSPQFQAAQKACQGDLPGKGAGLHAAPAPSGSASSSSGAAVAAP